MQAEVTTDGRIFEPGVERIIDVGMEDTLVDVADEGQRLVRRRLDAVLKNPSGHYESRIEFTVRQDNLVELHDSGVVYGPWLEGGRAGTRFRGYSTFRKTADEIQSRVAEVARGPLTTMARELER